MVITVLASATADQRVHAEQQVKHLSNKANQDCDVYAENTSTSDVRVQYFSNVTQFFESGVLTPNGNNGTSGTYDDIYQVQVKVTVTNYVSSGTHSIEIWEDNTYLTTIDIESAITTYNYYFWAHNPSCIYTYVY